jgi:hypothetical protein
MNRQQTLGLAAALLIGTGLSAEASAQVRCSPVKPGATRTGPAQDSSFTVTLLQEGPDVVATGSGTFNTTALVLQSTSTCVNSEMLPSSPLFFLGPTSTTANDYGGAIAGPANFGSGDHPIRANSGSGDFVGILSSNNELRLRAPSGYVSGNPLMSTSTWDDATFSSLGVTPGTYVWTWGSGANAGSFTLRAGVPEPATLGLMVLGLLGAVFAGRKRPN